MPEVDGLDLLRYIREDDRMKTVPVVMMSASERSENIFECIRDGAEDYLFKPLGRKEVQYIWQHVWRRRHTFSQVVPFVVRHGCCVVICPSTTMIGCVAIYALNLCTQSMHSTYALHATTRRALCIIHTCAQEEVSSDEPPCTVPTTMVPSTSRALVLPPTTTAAAVAAVTAHTMHAAESLGAWMAARTVLDVPAAFNVFCRAIALLKAHHVQGAAFGRLRPSQLCFASNGTLQLMPSGKAATPVCEQVRLVLQCRCTHDVHSHKPHTRSTPHTQIPLK